MELDDLNVAFEDISDVSEEPLPPLRMSRMDAPPSSLDWDDLPRDMKVYIMNKLSFSNFLALRSVSQEFLRASRYSPMDQEVKDIKIARQERLAREKRMKKQQELYTRHQERNARKDACKWAFWPWFIGGMTVGLLCIAVLMVGILWGTSGPPGGYYDSVCVLDRDSNGSQIYELTNRCNNPGILSLRYSVNEVNC
jgi:hypothetical protein